MYHVLSLLQKYTFSLTSGNAFTPRPRANIALKGVVFNIILKEIVLISNRSIL